MTLALAKQGQVEVQLKKENEKLRLQLAELADIRRENAMALQYSRVIKAKEEQLVAKDHELKASQVSRLNFVYKSFRNVKHRCSKCSISTT